MAEGFPVSEISDHLTDERTTIWLDLRDPDPEDLAVLGDEFGLHPVAVEDALYDWERPKIDRYRTHLFLTAYGARLDADTGELATSELSAFVLRQALITVRKDDGIDIGKVVDRWDASPDLSALGVGYLLYGLLDYIVDGHFEAVQSLDDAVEDLEDDLFADTPPAKPVQRRSFELRKSLVLLRRVVLPMREVVNTLMRRDLHIVSDDLMPYYQDVYDHVLRAAEWTDSLRDLVTTILETNLTIQGNRMNIITKKVTGWAAIIAVPTFITGFLRDERALPRVQRPHRLDHGPVRHAGRRAGPLRRLPPQGLDLARGELELAGDRPPAGRRVLARPAVDGLAEQVGVAGVPGVLLEQVEQQPAQAGVRAVGPAEVDGLAEVTVGGEERGEPLAGPPDGVVPQRVQRLRGVVGGGPELPVRVGAEVHAVPRRTVRVAGQPLVEAGCLHPGQVLEQAGEGQAGRADPLVELGLVEVVGLPPERRALPLESAEQLLGLGAGDRRLPWSVSVAHERHRTEDPGRYTSGTGQPGQPNAPP